MRKLFYFFVAAFLVAALVGLAADKASEKIVFETKMKPVAFQHAKHAERAKGDCKVCHDKLFPQSRAPMNYSPAMHKTAEAKKIACGACHTTGGTAFVSTGNCNRCHGTT
jgi:c(7)-type cytochrome triheme protein